MCGIIIILEIYKGTQFIAIEPVRVAMLQTLGPTMM